MESPGDGGDISHAGHKKKHKKHKKHKKRHHQDNGGGPSPTAATAGYSQHHRHHPDSAHRHPDHHTHKSPHKPQLKLKIKLGGQVLGTKNVPTFTVVPQVPQSPLMVVEEDDEPLEGVPIEQYRAWLDEDSNLEPLASSPVVVREAEQDEESRWLDALERGDLDVNGDLKREIDETLLTARQKALLQKQQAPPLFTLPPPSYAGPAPAELSQEMMVKREEKARKRRLQAAKKAEENKKQTIERLTKTSKTRGAKPTPGRRGRQPPPICPTIRYQQTARVATLSFPPGIPCPTPSHPRLAPPPPRLCGALGCSNPRKYSCAKTHVPLCSLECYRRNLLSSAPA